jgi:hypothetical protein
MFWMVAAMLVFPWLLGLVVSCTMGEHSPPPCARLEHQEGMMRETMKETRQELT